MVLGDLYKRLSYSTLRNHTMALDGLGTIKTEFRPQILDYLNDCLLDLYSRFRLLEKEVKLSLSPEIGFYYLLPKFSEFYVPADGEDSEPVRYILDTEELPFQDDVLKVLACFDEYGREVPLNGEEHAHSIMTPQHKVLQINCEHIGSLLSVSYQAKHPVITEELCDPINIPEVLLGGLCAYIAYKVYNDMGTQESIAKGQGYLVTYETECLKVEKRDMVNSSLSSTNVRFGRNGWV